MVPHQYPGKRIGYRQNIFVVQMKKIFIVLIIIKQIASVDSTVVDVIKITVFKRSGFHNLLSYVSVFILRNTFGPVRHRKVFLRPRRVFETFGRLNLKRNNIFSFSIHFYCSNFVCSPFFENKSQPNEYYSVENIIQVIPKLIHSLFQFINQYSNGLYSI